MVIWLQQFGMQLLIWLLALVDGIFGVFAAVSGIEPVNVKGSSDAVTLSEYFLSLSGVQRAFWLVFLASILICGVCTVVAIVKNTVISRGAKRHARTVAQSASSLFVSLAMAAMLVFGAGATDVLLGAINTAVNGDGSISMSANIIDVSLGNSVMYDADNIQGLNKYDDDGNVIYVSYLYKFERDESGEPLYFDEMENARELHLLKYIDPETGIAFDNWNGCFTPNADGTYTPNIELFDTVSADSGWVYDEAKDELDPDIMKEGVTGLFGTYWKNSMGFPTAWQNNGKIYPYSFNFLVAYLCTVIIAVSLCIAAFGLVKRLFDIVILFITLPGIAATIPLDDGAKFKLWRETVISKLFLAFGSVLSVNVFFIVAPNLWSVSLPAGGFTDTILKVFLVCGGALTISGGQLLLARLLGTSAEESREMGQSARTLVGGAMTGMGLAKAAGRGLFGYRNANGQRVGGLIKGGASLAGSVGTGAINAIGGTIGGQAYRHSKFGSGVSATRNALRNFGASSGWFGQDKTTGGNTLGSGISGGMGKLGGKFAGSKRVQKTGLNNGIGGAVRTAAEKRHTAARDNARSMLSAGNTALGNAYGAAANSELAKLKVLDDDFERKVMPGFEGNVRSNLPEIISHTNNSGALDNPPEPRPKVDDNGTY